MFPLNLFYKRSSSVRLYPKRSRKEEFLKEHEINLILLAGLGIIILLFVVAFLIGGTESARIYNGGLI